MNTAPLSLLGATVLLGGAGAGAAAALLLRTDSPATRVAATPTLAITRLTGRIDALVEENRVLQRRIEALELRPATDTRAPLAEPVSLETLQAFREEILASLDDQPVPTSAREELEEQVSGALVEIRKAMHPR